MKFLNTKISKGFTLIELMVVISIIGLLSVIVMASINTARTKSRNSYTISSLKQYFNAFELSVSDTGGYPYAAGGWACMGTIGGGNCYNNAYAENATYNTQFGNYIKGYPNPNPTTIVADNTYKGAIYYCPTTMIVNGSTVCKQYQIMYYLEKTSSCPMLPPGGTFPGATSYTGNGNVRCYVQSALLQ